MSFFVVKLRCGILPLRIETGRYDKVILEECTYKLCQSNVIEDEILFICWCNVLNVKHTALYSIVYLTTFYEFITYLSDTKTFVFLMKHRQTTFQTSHGKHISHKKKHIIKLNSLMGLWVSVSWLYSCDKMFIHQIFLQSIPCGFIEIYWAKCKLSKSHKGLTNLCSSFLLSYGSQVMTKSVNGCHGHVICLRESDKSTH